VEPTEDARSSVYPAASAYEETPDYAFGQAAGGDSIPLEDYDFGSYNN
jgi:hypothetical protein